MFRCVRSWTTASRSGVTIIELMVAMLSASVLAITAGIILVYCFRTLRANGDAVELQRDVDITTRTLFRAIRTARDNDTTVSGGGTTLELDGGARTFTFLPNGGGLVYDPNVGVSGDEQMLASNTSTNANECRFWDNGDSIRILLTVYAQDDTIQVDTDIHMRNEI